MIRAPQHPPRTVSDYGINVFAGDVNYRIPDLTFVSRDREHMLHDERVEI